MPKIKVEQKAVEKKEVKNSEKKYRLDNKFENGVSVITKTTKPKVVIQSEKIAEPKNCNYSDFCKKYSIVEYLYLIIMWIIVLITLFISIKTYNTVNNLANFIL